MSPLLLRRFRAERLLREEFEALRGRVVANVAARLRAAGAGLDRGDIEDCYAQAWQGLYGAVLEGREIVNPAGWLVLVTYRRAIDEQRARSRSVGGQAAGRAAGAPAAQSVEELADYGERDDDGGIAARLDDRQRLRQLLEAMRGRLDEREREAAALCYLHGLSRAEAARRMGLSGKRMRKLMEGRTPGRPGVAGKVGALAATIREGRWCEEQASLMRALAYGLLDPAGERYALAAAHRSECPACRAYVRSLRGLAAALPPVLAPWGLGAGALLRAAGHAHAAHLAAGGAGVPAAQGAAASGSAAGAAGVGSASMAGAGAGGAAGGGWALAGGPLGAKLAVGCLLAVGIGAGCAELGVTVGAPAVGVAPRTPTVNGERPLGPGAALPPSSLPPPAAFASAHARVAPPAPDGSGAGRAPSALLAPDAAGAEFGPERGGASAGPRQVETTSVAPRGRFAAAGGPARLPGVSPAQGPPVAGGAAAREFSPG